MLTIIEAKKKAKFELERKKEIVLLFIYTFYFILFMLIPALLICTIIVNTLDIVPGNFIWFFGSLIGFIILIIPRFHNKFELIAQKFIKLPSIFCPHCHTYIDGGTDWTCPYCKTYNNNFPYNPCTECKNSGFACITCKEPNPHTIYQKCKKCGRQADVIQCQKCDKQFPFSKGAYDGMIITIGKDKPKQKPAEKVKTPLEEFEESLRFDFEKYKKREEFHFKKTREEFLNKIEQRKILDKLRSEQEQKLFQEFVISKGRKSLNECSQKEREEYERRKEDLEDMVADYIRQCMGG